MKQQVFGTLFFAALAGSLSIATPNASAQNFNQTRLGDGVLTRDGAAAERIERANVSLQDNGNIRLLLTGQQKTQCLLSGRYTRGRDNRYDLRVDGTVGAERGSFSGTMTLAADRSSFEEFTLGGTIDGRRATIRFRNGSAKPGDNPGGGSGDDSERENNMDSTRDGSGRARSGRTTIDIPRARVAIRSNSDVDVFLYARPTVTLKGRVLRRRGDDIFLRLDGEFLGDRTSVEGFVRLRRRSKDIDRIQLDSKSGRSLEIRFDAR